jgi:hypothetical protein
MVNGTVFQATENLVSALYQLRHETEKLVIWVDAVCINQSDLNERSAQVQIMSSIYSGASIVICWLGLAADDCDLAFRMLKKWGDVLLKHGLEKPENIAKMRYMMHHTDELLVMSEDIEDPFNASDWEAVRTLAERPWWSRVWIVQEFVLGQDVVLQCGDAQLSWRYLLAVLLLTQPKMVPKLGFSNVTYFVFRSMRYLYLKRRAKQDITQLHDRVALVSSLWDTASRHTTDPRDRVYGIIGLVDEVKHSSLRVDYTLSIDEVYTDVARQSMLWPSETSPVLYILKYAGTSLKILQDGGETPTWAPSWLPAQRNGYRPTILDLIYTPAKEHSNIVPRFSQDGRVLLVHGVVIDQVKSTVESTPQGNNGKRLWQREDVWELAGISQKESYPTGIPRMEAFFRTTAADVRDALHRLDDDLQSAYVSLAVFLVGMLQTMYERQGKDVPVSSVLEELQRHHDLPSTSGLRPFFSSPDNGFPKFPDSFDFSQALKTEAHFGLKFDSQTVNRCYFSTSRKFIGLGPRGAKEGDLVCVLFGSNVPFVLRKHDGKYILIGEAYVHGYMDGEAMDEVEVGTLNLQEFAIN